jgi:hypothetical protein
MDIEEVRAATPGAGAAHHLNAAGCSLASRATLRAVIEHLELEARAGGYEAEVAAALTRRAVNVVAVPPAHAMWDLGVRGLPAVLRASPHVYNNDADLQALTAAVGEITGARHPGKEHAA